MSELKDLRLEKNLTQEQVAKAVGISLRSYISYENDDNKTGSIKYKYILEQLKQINPIDEEHGIISKSFITKKCREVFENYDIDFCYLFGSYAKNKATPSSDVDLLICSNITGIKYFGLVEELRVALHKKVDALDINQLNNNPKLLQEILKEGIKIYG